MDESIGDCKPYLDYLDQEMTIMGILSTFCVAVVSLILDRVWGADKESFFRTLWAGHAYGILAGSVFLLMAASFFYIQRSHLAYFCGGISMAIARPLKKEEWQLVNWLEEADSWHTWRYYRIGFAALTLGSVVYAHVLYRTIFPAKPALGWLVELVFLGFVLRAIVSGVIFSTYRYETKPFKAFALGTFLNDWKHRGEQEV